ncbi:P-loop containing nucleoside triphosphate hydrolase protein [Parathielavia appendiculata]|uniref:P-loop containing nucleoside triphosphate hydrolase protein n=1 Tax=Parathielavia appendiculata TaxID=2587402 RepID=A0AAN6Z826_9PEZI|nr:P-loop containing nucleoside triphosphate hydrolase protein [Parathielavia appendiculata]
MVLAKSKKSVGLGNQLMKDRFGKGKGGDRKRVGAVTRVDHATGEEYITNDREEAGWVKMRSVTEQGALDEFLATAELAGTDFTAEKMNNVKIIHTDQRNPYLLSAAEERDVLGKQREHKARLTVPRRPHWDASTTREELDRFERDSFLEWRKGLAELQETQDLLMTPFERNLEVWRQLWRVIERSDVVVQIVDARNPLMFRSEDLEAYVKDVHPKKQNLLLINKADMMTYKQRKAWANYLKGAGIAYRFFSAQLAKEMLEAGDSESEEEKEAGASGRGAPLKGGLDAERQDGSQGADHEQVEASGEADTRILSVDELESMLLHYAPEDAGPDRKLQVGLVGYPNVGKSSTINALIGAKKVSVSSTPGKTKHFQTIHLSDKVILCDCPGLVFPNFASTKAELVCNGVLPIDQLREYSGPATLVARRIPQAFLEAIYGIQIRTRPLEEGGTGIPTGEELLSAYARHRGFMTQGLGQPDQSRAARYVLKDYVNGKLLWVEPPPGVSDPQEFNRELYDISQLPAKRRAVLAAAMEELSVEGDDSGSVLSEMAPLPRGLKSERLDKAFFKAGQGSAGHLSRPFNYKYSEQGKAEIAGKQLSGRKLRTMIALEKGIDPKDVQIASGKKHFKGGQKARKFKGSRADEDD